VLSHPSTQFFFVFDRSNQAANANERLIAIDAPIQTIPSSIDIDHHSINNKCAAQND
jgi:nanoRNase/pAp phosphatase (c-di-AMP/oligoRNAs hydrolase)